MRVGPSLAAVLAVWCGLAAWLVCDFQCLGAYPGDARVRAAAVFGGALGGTLLGAILQRPAVARSTLRTTLTLFALLPIVGGFVGLGAVVSSGSSSSVVIRESTLSGLLGGLACVPGVALAARAARRANRARPGSVLHEIERRGVWTLPAATMTVGSVVALVGNPGLLKLTRQDPAPALAIALVATTTLLITFAQEVSASRFARRVAATASELRPREAGAAEQAHVPQIDIGIGDQVFEHCRSMFSYRSAENLTLIVRGDPLLGNKLATRAALRTGVALTIGIAATGVSLQLVS